MGWILDAQSVRDKMVPLCCGGTLGVDERTLAALVGEFINI
jgi:hypothetical protein